MRVLLLNQVFFPDVAATAQHAHDLGRHLVEHGHEVAVIASRSIYGQKGATLVRHELVDGIVVHRVGFSLFGKAGIIARAIDFAIFYLAAMLKAFTIKRPDVIICFTTPPFIGKVGWLLRVFRRTKYVYWAMDLYPDVLVAGGMLKPRSLVARLLTAFNRFIMKRADRVVVLGRCMKTRVANHGVPLERIVHIGVWSDHDEVKPVDRAANPYRKEWSLGDRFVVTYAGNFGLVHDVETMCAAAEQLKDDEKIAFAFIGGGKRKLEVERFVTKHHLSCTLAPYQPREKLDAMLSCADVHLVTLKPGYEGIVVPSKLFGIMAAGRPTIYIGPPESEVALILKEHNCGVVIAPGDVGALCAAIRNLAEDEPLRKRMGDNARRALQQLYDRRHACEAWRLLLEGLVSDSSPQNRLNSAAKQGTSDARA